MVGRCFGKAFCSFPAVFTSSEVGCSNLQLQNANWTTPEPNSACVYCPGAVTVLERSCCTFLALGEGEEGLKNMCGGMDNFSETESQGASYSSRQSLPVALSPGNCTFQSS